VNTEFCELVGENHLKVRVHERGVGETYACGTGACAAAVAAIVQGICSPMNQIIITMLGGELKVKCDETRTVRLLGDATNVFCGYVEL
jgi:diaminopimelate epimerase